MALEQSLIGTDPPPGTSTPPGEAIPNPGAPGSAALDRRPGIKGWAVFVFSLLLVLASSAQLVYRSTLPTDGWSVRAGAFGTEAGNQYTYLDNLVGVATPLGVLDRVYAVNGSRIRPQQLALEPNSAAMRDAWESGLALDYSVLRGGIVRQVAVSPVAWTPSAWVRFNFLMTDRLAASLGALLLIGVGVFVFVRRPAHPAARALLLVCAALFAQWVSTSLPDGISVLLDPLARSLVSFFSYSIFLALVAPAILLFALLFPHPTAWVKRHPWIQILPFAVAWSIWGAIVASGAVAWNWLGMIPFLLLAFAVMAWRIFTTTHPVESAQLRVAGWGFLIGVAVSLLSFLPIFGIVTGDAANLLRAGNSVGVAVIALGLAVAILRYRLLDIDLILRRSLAYSIVTALLVIIYLASVIVLQRFFQSFVGEQSSLAVVISTLAIAALFNPLRKRVQEWIDERFYRSRYDAERVAAEFARMAQDEPDLDRLTDEFLNVIRDSFEPTRASLWLLKQESQSTEALPAGRVNLELPDGDPLFALLAESEGVTDLQAIRLDSVALANLRAADFRIAVPLVNQGELLGCVNLGERRSDQEYSSDDKRLLVELANRAAPSIRVAQLVRQQQIETRDRERMASELRVARIIQETLLPKQLPALPGYQLSAYWQPAQAVGGDFYDFIQFDDGSMALIVGDVTDKGVPAALVMSTTRAVLRAAAERHKTPGAVLQYANDVLCPDMPPKMFVTVLYAVLDPATGHIRYANAGHDLPYLRRARAMPDAPVAEQVEEMRATGMPLGLLPGMRYEEREVDIAAGDTMVVYSDGLVEAHNTQREMFSFRRLRELIAQHGGGEAMVAFLLERLAEFAGADWEQEDDVTIVTLQRAAIVSPQPDTMPAQLEPHAQLPTQPPTQTSSLETNQAMPIPERVAAFTVSSAPGNERLALHRVAEAVADLQLSSRQLERLKTAVAEATMNAMEHGNGFNPTIPVAIEVLASSAELVVRISDQGGDRAAMPAIVPDLDAKLEGLQSPRGWGLFLIQSMVDQVTTTTNDGYQTVELRMKRGA